MAYIAERVFVLDASRKAIVLNNTEYLRRLTIGNDWNQINIGVLCAVQGNGTIQNRTSQFSIGICSDMSGYSPLSTKHFVGCIGGAGASLTYTANSGNPYYVFQPTFARKIGTSVTTAGVGTIQFFIPILEGTLLRKVPMWIQITRTSSAVYTVQNVTMAAGGMATDYALQDMLDAMDLTQGSPISARGNSFSVSTANTLNGTENDGNLNTVSIYWGSQLFPLEIYGLAVYRVR